MNSAQIELTHGQQALNAADNSIALQPTQNRAGSPGAGLQGSGRSLRKTLLWTLVSTLALLGLISGLISYFDALTEANELFDAKLAHSARVLKAVTDPQTLARQVSEPMVVEVWQSDLQGRGDDLITIHGHVYETKLSFQVFSGDQQLLLRSSNAGEQALAPLQEGFADVLIDGRRWRTFTLRDSRGKWFQTGEDQAIRGELAEGIAQSALIPWLFAVPVMALVVWLVVGAGCRSLQRIAEQVEHRDPERLTPVRADQAPKEIFGLVVAINGLLERLESTLERERRFTADAAHELRTPLAALKVHAQNLSKARNPQESARSLAGLLSGVDRSQRLIDQLLELARLEPTAELMGTTTTIDLADCLARQMADLAPFADERQVRLELQRPATPLRLAANELSLDVLFRNLIDNAIRYGPIGGEVTVQLHRDAGEITVEICDQGPGIAEAEREKMFERFHRGLGSGQSGSGLGLSIAQKVAELHRARIELAQNEIGGGLRVSVRFAQADS